MELHAKVEAMVRNSLLRRSRYLVEVAGTPLFDQSFCFKHISLFVLRQEHISAGTHLFLATPKILHAEVR